MTDVRAHETISFDWKPLHVGVDDGAVVRTCERSSLILLGGIGVVAEEMGEIRRKTGEFRRLI